LTEEKCANVQILVNLLMIHVHQDSVINLKRLSLAHKQTLNVQQNQNVVRKVQLLMMPVEKKNVIHANLELSNLKNVKQHALNANVDMQVQKQDLNLKSVHVVSQEILLPD